MMVEASELSAEQIRKANLIQVIWTSRPWSCVQRLSPVCKAMRNLVEDAGM